jgi:Bacterial TSP3 repeat
MKHWKTILICSVLLPATTAVAEPLLRCAQNLCLLTHGSQDTDGDGVSDDDERAAGSDPNDPASTPRMSRMLDLIRFDKLPSYHGSRSVLVVLPTRAPNGKQILGGLTAMPSRQNTLAALGITAEKVAHLDLANGLAIARGQGAASAGKPPMKVGGVSMALISGGSGPAMPPAGAVANTIKSAGCAWCASDPTKISTNSATVGTNAFGVADFTEMDALLGTPTGHTATTQWTTTENGYQVTTNVFVGGKLVRTGTESESRTKEPDNTTTTVHVKTSEDASKKSTETVKENTGGTKSVEHKSENKKTGEVKSKETTFVDGKETHTKTCNGSDCTTTFNNVCDAACQDAAEGKGSAYYSPDDTSYDPGPDLRRVGLTVADTMSTAIAILHGNLHLGDPPIETEEVPASSTPDGPLVMHIDEDPAGNMTFGIGVGMPKQIAQPRIDPNLPLNKGDIPQACSAPGTC